MSEDGKKRLPRDIEDWVDFDPEVFLLKQTKYEFRTSTSSVFRNRQHLLEKIARAEDALSADAKRIFLHDLMTQQGEPVAHAVLVYQAGPSPAEPPKAGFLDWLMEPAMAADARANLDEVYEYWRTTGDEGRARRLYYWHATRIAVRDFFDVWMSRAERLIKTIRPIGPS